MINIPEILTYWRHCLSDADRMGIDFKKVEHSPEVHPADLVRGRVPPEVYATLNADQGQKQGGKSTTYRPIAAEPLNVILCPLVVRSLPAHGQALPVRNPTLLPLWIPAQLAPNGELHPPEDLVPWIARDYLEPADHLKQLLGNVDALDRYLVRNQLPSPNAGWVPYWAYCCAMLTEVTGLSIDAFNVEGYELARDTAYLISANSIQGTRRHVIRLCEDLIRERRSPGLLQTFTAAEPAPLRPLLTSAEQRQVAQQHLGQMSNNFELSPSQREALHHILPLGYGGMLAINGPPGTGKTTLIQSIVASLWVEAAIQGGEPLIIVAASTNNQAVTNIIDSFGKGTPKPNPLAERWLPDINSYGLYCVSVGREIPASKQLQTLFPRSEWDKTGFFATIETPAYVQRASREFLDRFAAVLGQRAPDAKTAVVLLQQRLIATVNELETGVAVWGDLCTTRERIVEDYCARGGIDAVLSERHGKLAALEASSHDLWHSTDAWKKQRQQRPWLARLGLRRKQVEQANRDYIGQHAAIPSPSSYDDKAVDRAIRQHWDALTQEKAAVVQQIEVIEQSKQRLDELSLAWDQWYSGQHIPGTDVAPERVFDTKLRYEAFCLASHYWEARWLVEAQQALSTDRSGERSQQQQERRWRRYAKLTPCFVSTLFMVPAFFSYGEKQQATPLYEYIDLLIVDEAGQVASDIVGATLALAKKAIIVGDKHQIEPVYALTSSVDEGNLRRYGRVQSEDQLLAFRRSGLSASQESLMVAAQRVSLYQVSHSMRGMMLLEHRRCLPEIIAYCNELAYDNKLEPKRVEPGPWPLPQMGYAHIPGVCTTVRGSRENTLEIDAIVQWLIEQRAALEQHYNKRLHEVVGIVTPFARQAEQIRAMLRRHGLSALTAGTIHTLQGAERPIVIFSPVYSDPGSFFFDQGVNMLNVAVSRAQDSFLVFGNMAIFEPYPASADKRGRPSSLLARHLFAVPSNELHITIPQHPKTGIQSATQHLKSLSDHRTALVTGFQQAHQRIVVVSPYLSEFAIKSDRVDDLIMEALRREVEVLIYTDHQLDIDPQSQQLKPSAAAARKLLRESGAELRIVSRVHTKALCIDDATIVIGSFNWLSAVRDESHRYQRHEDSIKYEGPGVSKMIADLIAEMEDKRIASRTANVAT